jgi:hypothetical protein
MDINPVNNVIQKPASELNPVEAQIQKAFLMQSISNTMDLINTAHDQAKKAKEDIDQSTFS